MALFGQLFFAIDRCNYQITKQVTRRRCQYSFDVFKNYTNMLSSYSMAPDFQYLDIALIHTKPFLTDIIEVVNNSI